MTRIIAVASQKGGVGKTTTAVNLAFCMQMAGLRTLLVDLDPQANATSGLGCDPPAEPALGSLADDPGAWPSRIAETCYDHLWVLPAAVNVDYGPLIAQLDPLRIGRLRDELCALDPAYEFALLDCPPATGPISMLALQLADSVLIPVQCEYYAMEGLSQMLPMIEKVRCARTRPLELEGILLTMYDEELTLSHEVHEEVRNYFPDHTLESVIPRDVALAESTSHGKPILEYDLRSRGSWSYVRLAKEILHGH